GPRVTRGPTRPGTGGFLPPPGPAPPSGAPLPNSLRPRRQLLPKKIGEEGRNLRAPRRQRAEREADGGAAQPRLPRAPPLLARHHQRALHGRDLGVAQVRARSDVERLADREQADRDHDDVDAAEQLALAEREP